jgi:DNA polymerase-3 subunit chi
MNPKVVFYDVEPEAWDAQIHKLAAAAWDRGSKMMILVDGPERAKAVDGFLWTLREEVFLPHEVVRPGQPLRDEEARVLISEDETHPQGATLLVQDHPSSMEFALRFEVVMDVVDRRSDERTAASRARYKAWRDRGITPEHLEVDRRIHLPRSI